MGASLGDVGHRHGFEPDPGVQALHESIAFRHRQQRIHHSPVHQPKISCARRNLKAVRSVDQVVEPVRTEAFEHAFITAGRSDGIRHVGALLPMCNEGLDQRRRVLHVGVHRHDHLACGGLQAGGEGRFLAEVARQLQVAKAGQLSPPGQQRVRLVGAAVIDQNDFPGTA